MKLPEKHYVRKSVSEKIIYFYYQVEQQLLEEEFIAQCFEEMWAEEEAQWQFYVVNQQAVGYVPLYYSTETQSLIQTDTRTSLVGYL